MSELALFFVRPMVDEDVERLLQIRIRRISAFDVDKHKKELEEIQKRIRAANRKLHGLSVQYRERSRVPQTDGARPTVRRSPKRRGAAAEHLGPRLELSMDLEPDHRLVGRHGRFR